MPPKRLSPYQEEFSFSSRWITYRGKQILGMSASKAHSFSAFCSASVPHLASTASSRSICDSHVTDPSHVWELGWTWCEGTSVPRCSALSTVPKDSKREGHIITKSSKHQVPFLPDAGLLCLNIWKAFNTQCSWPPKLKFISLNILSSLIYFDKSYLYSHMEREGERKRDSFSVELTFHK